MKLGKRKKSAQKWRKPRGRDSKVRLRRKSYPKRVDIGYGSPRKERGKVKGKLPVVVHNLSELKSLRPAQIAVLSSTLGAKKKVELINYAREHNLEILNVRSGGKNEA